MGNATSSEVKNVFVNIGRTAWAGLSMALSVGGALGSLISGNIPLAGFEFTQIPFKTIKYFSSIAELFNEDVVLHGDVTGWYNKNVAPANIVDVATDVIEGLPTQIVPRITKAIEKALDDYGKRDEIPSYIVNGHTYYLSEQLFRQAGDELAMHQLDRINSQAKVYNATMIKRGIVYDHVTRQRRLQSASDIWDRLDKANKVRIETEVSDILIEARKEAPRKRIESEISEMKIAERKYNASLRFGGITALYTFNKNITPRSTLTKGVA